MSRSHRFKFTGDSLERASRYTSWKRDEQSKMPPVPAGSEEPEQPVPAKAAVPKPDTGAASRTHTGKVRSLNEDSVIDMRGLYGVADGMGGHNAGEVASGCCRDLLAEKLSDRAPDGELLRTAIEEVNLALFEKQEADGSLSGMGTTLTVLWVGKDRIYIGHVGDSRAYRLRGGALEQMTLDHSMVAEMVRQGLITNEEAAGHPMRNVITRAIGTEDTIETDILEEEKLPGDIWLVCSDGLHGLVKKDVLESTLRENDPETAADLLLQAALDAGGRDNISLVIFPVKEEADA